jgi:hypothetical protein
MTVHWNLSTKTIDAWEPKDFCGSWRPEKPSNVSSASSLSHVLQQCVQSLDRNTTIRRFSMRERGLAFLRHV